ncbi:hypothetical protein RUM43_002228 [Polyplax serrata]|uniref:t-SNARE coiled-coil homology domain-containing protein n=1 Tax=Polyplax serrata TaxID=468196 RepID=A0AAN8S961_POLSC
MGTLLEDYEQQYAVLTAEITAKISQLGLQCTTDKKKLNSDVEKHMEEAQELLEQMELEVREVDVNSRPKFRTRVDSYRAELGRLSFEFMKVKNSSGGLTNSQEDLFGEGFSLRDEQKQRLLDNSERIERTGNNLKDSYRVILETEEIGSNILQDLYSQRETIEKSRNRLREADAELGRSSRLLTSMVHRSLQNKFILGTIAVVFFLVVVLTIYISVST